MKCCKCKKEIPEKSRYCLYCGAVQVVMQKRRTRGNGQGTAIKRGNTWTAIWTVEIYPDTEERKSIKSVAGKVDSRPKQLP